MKKITIATAILITGTVFANAEINSQEQKPREIMRRPLAQQNVASSTRVMPLKDTERRVEGMKPIVTPGDKVTDAQVKALVTEMEAKVKLIRDEYQAKIKAILDARKANNGTSTRPIMPRIGDENRQNTGSSTDGNIKPMPRRPGEVRGINTEVVGQDVGSRMMGFFRGMFGGK